MAPMARALSIELLGVPAPVAGSLECPDRDIVGPDVVGVPVPSEAL